MMQTSMVRFFKSRHDDPWGTASRPAAPAELGHLEVTVMEILWRRGQSNVHDVVAELGRPLAYTTVMTTLDRLYKKGLLDRQN
jgi:hypothetical protein